jgi:hypothetical protein
MSGFLLSIGRVEIFKINLFCGVLMVLLLFIFHKDFSQMINVMLISSLLLFASLFIYYWKNVRR